MHANYIIGRMYFYYKNEKKSTRFFKMKFICIVNFVGTYNKTLYTTLAQTYVSQDSKRNKELIRGGVVTNSP